ncbi:hypothetical protein A2U01_0059419, partial [Trifolium medium]|nr:hypothetical protein [Trifolium medium]
SNLQGCLVLFAIFGVAGSSPCCVVFCHASPCAGSVTLFGWFDSKESLMPAVFIVGVVGS